MKLFFLFCLYIYIINKRLQRNFFKFFYKYLVYRNTMYWDAALKYKNLGICACIKHALWPFWITIVMPYLKLAFTIQIFKINSVIPCTGMHTLKPKYLEIDAALNTLFSHFWIKVLMLRFSGSSNLSKNVIRQHRSSSRIRGHIRLT